MNKLEKWFKYVKSVLLKIEKYKIFAITISLMIGQSLYILLPALLGWLIDGIFVQENLKIAMLLLFPIMWSLSVAFTMVSKLFISIVTQDVRRFSKDLIFQYLIGLPTSVYVNKGAGEVESLMQEVSFTSRYLFTEAFPFFIRIVTSITISILVLSYSSFNVGMLFIAWLSLYVPLSYFLAKGAMTHVSKSLTSSAEVSALTVDVIANHELIPAFGTEKYETVKFQQHLDHEHKSYLNAQLQIDKADLWQQFLQLLLPFGIVFYIIFAEHSRASPGDIVALLAITLVVTGQIRDFGRGILASFEAKERMKNALSRLDSFCEKTPHSIPAKTEVPASYDIKFDKVSFAYDTNNNVLHNVSFSVKENERIGIIGYSGAGKSTLMRMLRGYYKATSGTISLGNVCLKELDPKFLTENISEVSQTTPLFHRSIRENVAYGCYEVTDDKIWHILERAQLADYVKKLPSGLNTIIGVKGAKMSGGERARLAIARAFLKDSKIIILDEATASLDSESESLLQKGLEELMSNRTVIAIAHRLATLRSMDRILMFEKGQLIADGLHDDLVKENTLYKKLWDMQVLI